MARFALIFLVLLAPATASSQTAPARKPDDRTAGDHKVGERAAGRKAERTPVVEAPRHEHAQKPADKKAADKKPSRVVAKPKAAPVPVAPPAEAPPAAEQVPADQSKGSVTGLPLPRFAALRTDEVNLRAGPGTRYPIDWVYKRRDLPVEIEREFEVWRLIKDPDGVKGWVHQATLVGRRDFVVTGDERVMRQTADDAGAPVAKLKPGVIGHIRSCDPTDWCEVQVQDYRGYLKRSEFWGAYPAEVVGG